MKEKIMENEKGLWKIFFGFLAFLISLFGFNSYQFD